MSAQEPGEAASGDRTGYRVAVTTATVAGSNGIAALTESALAARRRVEDALRALETEMGNLAVDFC